MYTINQSGDLDKGNVFHWLTTGISNYLPVSVRTYRDGGEWGTRFTFNEKVQ